MSSERLDALLRQRALITQHLSWLDSEIARVTGSPSAEAPPPEKIPGAVAAPPQDGQVATSPAEAAPPAPPKVLLPEASPHALAAANARADEIIAQYSATDRFDEQGTRRGCILLTIALFLLGTAGLIAVYLFRYRQ